MGGCVRCVNDDDFFSNMKRMHDYFVRANMSCLWLRAIICHFLLPSWIFLSRLCVYKRATESGTCAFVTAQDFLRLPPPAQPYPVYNS